MRVSLYGAGQLSTNVARVLAARSGIEVLGPFGRERREQALGSGADVVLIATTSFLAEIGGDIRTAVEAGSNVITSAEEAAYPWANDEALARDLDLLARQRGVTILGAGVNPGFAFDALVLTLSGAASQVDALRVERVVDLSGFGETVLRRIGVGHRRDDFLLRKADGTITGHIGFPQSMRVVAAKLGVTIERIDREIEPIIAQREHRASHMTVAPGESAGFEQRYQAFAAGEVWFDAVFTGHVEPSAIGKAPRDAIRVEGPTPLQLEIEPGLNAQTGSSAMIANSFERVVYAPAGWLTVGDLPPAVPGPLRAESAAREDL